MTFDIESAFLYGKFKESIHITQPEGFDDGTGRVCNQSLCGLEQALKTCYVEFSSYLESLGFVSTDDDPCVYYNHEKGLFIALFIDDDGCWFT